MRKSAIRHLAITDEPAIVAAAFFESKVQIWSWKTSQQIGEFETILDFGGRRLALSPDGRICITGSYSRGLAAYSIPDGRLLWHRRDLRKLQLIYLNALGSEIYCGDDRPSVHIIETETGNSLGKVARADRIVPSQTGPHQLVSRRQDAYTVTGPGEFAISAVSFGLLDAAFSPEAVCLAEPKTGIRCIDLVSGSVLWHHQTLGANHLAFNSLDMRFYCVGGLDTEPHESSLIRLASNLYDCERVVTLSHSYVAAFSPSGANLITMGGEVYESSTGNLLTILEVPQRDYPDALPPE